ncbi:MAG: fucose isomerase [Actinomycetota bacterium]
MERSLASAFERMGITIRRAHTFDEEAGHGFIDSQARGIEVFRGIDPEAQLVVAESVWQYSHHVLAGLRSHRGPILTVANWSGEWPGLVGVLNLNASLTKAGVAYSSLWSEDFTDEFFVEGLRSWVNTGRVEHNTSHVHPLDPGRIPNAERQAGTSLARHLVRNKAVLGVFDEGCMGMYNAIFDDELLNPLGIYKERLSQSSLLAEMRLVTDEEADSTRSWIEERGMSFATGSDPATELTDDQIRDQLKMYVAAVRIADDFGCDVIGIQYQQGLKDMAPASDLAEGLLNNEDRPPVRHRLTGELLYEGRPVTHFNEVDEGAGVDALVTRRILAAMGFDSATTLHDVRWGAPATVDGEELYVWVLMISGSVPPSHNIGGYAGTTSERQPPMYFPSGGGTVKGVSKPGEIVWSRVFIEDGRLKIDLGRATVVTLPDEETERRWEATTPQWPIMHAVLHGVDRNQFMARHKANHVSVAYAPDAESADRLLAFKAAAFHELGVDVCLSGSTALG